MVGPWPHRAFTFRTLSTTYGQMWLRCDVCRRYARLKLAGLHDVDYRTYTLRRRHELRPEVRRLTSQVYSANGPRLVGYRPIAASVMTAAFCAEAGFSRRTLDPSAA
jgi:hypothetical protein